MTAIGTTEDLVTAVPFLVGYTPSDSIVIIGLNDDSIDFTMRVDYPKESNFEQYSHLAKTIMAQGVKELIVVGYVPSNFTASEVEVMVDLQITLNHYKLTIIDSIVIVNGKYRSLLSEDSEDKPLPDVQSSKIALDHVMNGLPFPFESAAALKASLRSHKQVPEIVEHIKNLEPITDIEGCRLGAKTFDKLLQEFSDTGKCSDNKEVALLLVALKNVLVRDYLLGTINDDNSQDVENLWRWLLLVAPEGYRASVASLSAAVAYEYGRGGDANALIEIALDDEQGYSLATLLQRVFSAAWPPSSFKRMRDELHPKVVATLFETV